MPVVKSSRFSFSETVARLVAAIGDRGNTVFATIDQTAAAADAGLRLRPTTLIVFGNPKGGTPLMDAFPLVGLEFPLKLLVWEQNGVVQVGYVPAAELVERYGLAGKENVVAAMDANLALMIDAVV